MAAELQARPGQGGSEWAGEQGPGEQRGKSPRRGRLRASSSARANRCALRLAPSPGPALAGTASRRLGPPPSAGPLSPARAPALSSDGSACRCAQPGPAPLPPAVAARVPLVERFSPRSRSRNRSRSGARARPPRLPRGCGRTHALPWGSRRQAGPFPAGSRLSPSPAGAGGCARGLRAANRGAR